MPLPEVRERVALSEGLTADDLRERLPSGQQPVFTNRVAWAIAHMKVAGLVEKVRRGVYRLAEDGEQLLAHPPPRVDLKLLRNYPSYVQWRSGKSESSFADESVPVDDSLGTPEEKLDRIHRQLQKVLEDEVLNRVREGSPAFLEQVVVDLLIAMGYGGGDAGMGQVTVSP